MVFKVEDATGQRVRKQLWVMLASSWRMIMLLFMKRVRDLFEPGEHRYVLLINLCEKLMLTSIDSSLHAENNLIRYLLVWI